MIIKMVCCKIDHSYPGFVNAWDTLLTIGKEYEIDDSRHVGNYTKTNEKAIYVIKADSGLPCYAPESFLAVANSGHAQAYPGYWVIKKGFEVSPSNPFYNIIIPKNTGKHKCHCKTRDLMAYGCKCGGV
jgi:hypothetical protein